MDLKSLLLENLSPKQTVLKNSFWIGLTQGLSRLLKLVLVIFSARMLGPNGFGAFSYILAIVSLYFLFSDWGTNTLLIRDYQQKKGEIERYLNAGLAIKAILVLLGFLASIIGIFIFESEGFRKLAILLSVFLVLERGKEFLNSIFRARQRMEKQFLVDFSEIVITVLSGILLLVLQRDVISLSWAYILGAIASCGLAAYLLRDYLPRLRPMLDKQLLKYFFINGMPLVLFGVLGFVFFSSDQVVLGYFKGTVQVGFYSVATRAVFAINTLSGVVLGALYPYLAAKAGNQVLMKKLFPRDMLFFLGLGLAAAAVGSLAAPLIPFFFGAEYSQSVAIFQIVVWILVFMFPTAFLDHLLLSYNRQWQNFLITAACALFDLALNLIFIPRYGMLGAGVSSIVGQLLNLILSFVLGARLVYARERVQAE